MSNITNNSIKDPLIGRSLGDFLVEKKLGEGGFGAVYKATQITLSRPAVIKVLHTKHRENQNVLERFKREAYLASRLEHPYMAHIYSFGAEIDGLLWIAMEMVAGTPLDEILKSQGVLPLERFIPLLDKICEVVHTAHEAGIIHRDLKPANVMVISRAGRLLPKLLDFGIAKGLNTNSQSFSLEKNNTAAAQNTQPKSSGKTTDPNQQPPIETVESLVQEQKTEENKAKTGIIGSPPYMSPEQWGSDIEIDTRTDIYALGVMSYEILTGEVPFRDSGYALMYAHIAKPVPPLGKAFAPVLDSILAKAMAKKPEERYQTALEFAKDFREAAGFSEQQINLPQLDELLKENLLANAPKPIADTLASLVIARNAYQFRDRVLLTFRVLVHYVGVLALASYVRSSTNQQNNELVTKAITNLRQHGLSESKWAEVSRELCRPFAKKRDAFPIPELINLFFAEDSEQLSPLTETFSNLLQIQHEIHSSASLKEESLVKLLADFLAKLTSLLKATTWLSDYHLVLPEGSQATKFMGKGQDFGLVAIKSSNLADGKAVLVDANGYFVLSLWPLVEITPPTPGAPLEVFLLERKGRSGAKLVSFPDGFEIEEESPWQWFKEHFFTDEEKKQTKLLTEKSPYLGLTTFSPTDSSLFFGRERETESFLNRLRIQPLLAVVGPSGAGKSSFIQAGVVAGLGENWQVATVRPGLSPLSTLASKLSKLGLELKDLKSELQKDTDYLGNHLRQFASKQNNQLLLVVDQFEEIITLCLDKDEQRLYVEAIVSTARSEEDPIRVVLTMRDDFLVRAKELKSLKDRLTQCLEILTTPDSTQLLKILTEPARQAGYEFEDRELPVEIVDAIAGQTSALPLIAFTAAKLWEQRDKEFKQLRRRSYELMGGVGGALAKHAEELMQQISQAEQSFVREAFRHLVTSEGTRAILTRPEVLQLLGKTSESETVIEKLISARLLVATEGEKGVDRIEVVHEALLSSWPRLVKWRQEDAEGARLRDQLRSAARQWQERNRPNGLLWRGEALTEYQLWCSRYHGKLTEHEEAFGKASIAEAAKSRHIRQVLASTATVFLLVVLVVIFFQRQAALENAKRADENAKQTKEKLLEIYEEQGRQELLRQEPLSALLYLNEAYNQGRDNNSLRFLIARSMETVDLLSMSLNHGDSVLSAQFSSDGKRMLSTSNNNTVKMWDVESGNLLLTLSAGSAQFSPDGKKIVAVDYDGTPKIWNVASGNLFLTLSSRVPSFFPITKFSNDGKKIITSSENNTAKIWEVESGKLLTTLSGHLDFIDSVNFSNNGERVATASNDKTARIWDVESGKLLITLSGHNARVNSVDFSNDLKKIVTSSDDKTIKLWNVESGELITTLHGHSTIVLSAEFSNNGKRIVTASWDNTARVWDVDTGKLIVTLPHTGRVNSAKFDSNGKRIVTASWDNIIRIWNIDNVKLVTIFPADLIKLSNDGKKAVTVNDNNTVTTWNIETGKPIYSFNFSSTVGTVQVVKFSNDAKKIVGINNDKKTAKIWDIESGKLLTTFADSSGNIILVDFNNDGKKIITVSDDNTAKIWDVESGKLLVTLPVQPPSSSLIGFAILSNDGKKVVTTGENNTAKIWDIGSGKLLTTLSGHTNFLRIAEFSNNGKKIITGSNDNTAKIWDVESSKLLATLSGHSGNIPVIHFNNDGKKVVTASDDNTAKIWDVESSKLLASLFHTGVVESANFNNDGKIVVTTSEDKTAKIWDVESGKLLTVLSVHSDRVLSGEFSSDGKVLAISSYDNTSTIWDVNLESRSPLEIAKVVKQKLPFKLEQGRLIVTKQQ